MLTETRAPGKLILLGEYAVLEGAPALVCAVDRYAKAGIGKRDDGRFSIESPTLGIGETKFSVSEQGIVRFFEAGEGVQRQLGFFKVIFEFVFHYFKTCEIETFPVALRLDTGAFYSAETRTKLGFGSSAAMTVALTEALFDAFAGEKSLNRRARIFRLALSAHRRAQGNLGSGVDIAASAFGGVLVYEMGYNHLAEQKLPEAADVWDELPLFAVWSGKSESTRKMVRGVGLLKKSHPDLYNSVIHDLSDLAEAGCRSYRERQQEAFLRTVSEYQNVLKKLGDESGMPIVSEVHLKLAESIGKSGGVYKPSGAGSGDVGIAFARSSSELEHIRGAVEKSGYLTVPVGIAAPRLDHSELNSASVM